MCRGGLIHHGDLLPLAEGWTVQSRGGTSPDLAETTWCRAGIHLMRVWGAGVAGHPIQSVVTPECPWPMSSVQFSRSVVFSSLWPHEPQHARPPYPSPTPGVHPNPRPLGCWCHPTISSCHPLLLLLSIFPIIRVFSNESALCIRWPKYWSFSFNISPSDEHPGLIFRMDWLDLLAVQGILKSLLQYQSSKASVLQCSAFFTVQLSHSYMTTGKTIALTRRTFVDKVMSLLFNMLSSLVITFLPRSKRLLISWLQSPTAVILECPKIKSDTVFTVSPSFCHEVMGPDAMILVFWMLSFKPTFSPSSFTFIK